MDLEQLYRSLGNLFSPADFERRARELCRLEQRVCHDDFDASTLYVVNELRQAGFRDVERIEHVADGETSVCDAVMPEAWNLDGRATLKVVSPWPDSERIIADTDETTLAAATWCGATPEDGSTGELIEWDPARPENAAGKWVLYDGVPVGKVNQPLAKAGALGMVVTDFAAGWRDPDATRWMNGQGLWGWYYLKGEPRIPIFVVTARRALALKNELRAGRPVILRGLLRSRWGKGKVYTVTGRIPGESEEEYGLFAHMYEPFLSDDSSGVSAGIEIGRMLRKSGLKLRKSLRVVFSFEHYGFVAYLASGRHHLKAAMNLDTLANTMYRDLGLPLQLRLSTLSRPFFGDLVMLDLLRRCEPGLRIDAMPGNLSDDTMGGEPSYGVPTNWLHVGLAPSPFHHSSAPIFDDVDWQLAAKVCTLDATLAAFLLAGEPTDFRQELPALKQLALETAQLHRDDTPFARKVRCDFAEQQLLSLNSWMPGVISDAEAAALPAPGRLPGAAPAADGPNAREAARLFPERLELGTPWCLARVPYAERDYCDGRINLLFYTLLDGRRTLLEAVRMADVALGSRTSDQVLGNVIRFMRYLARYGYLRLNEK